jgi:hypothetical protein
MMAGTPKRMTGMIIGACGLVLGAREAYVLLKQEPDSTESECIWSVASFPVVPFVAGFLAGHLFWQAGDVYKEEAKR